ncbi:cell adhesion molecule 3-like [Battus philenor]|uniref:cell adhesion molecule 3-like n=1 Tax=Battus philenor TaxID=42288 RepID=UPI0035D01F3E
MMKMRSYVLIAALFMWKQDCINCLRLLELRVPTHAAKGGEAILGCQFDLENDVLYSVKWYKDGREFYRYIPMSDPPISHFATPGVMVDVSRSSNTVVTLVHLSQESSGLYRCEVSGEAPLFATVYEEKYVTIYLLPESKPQLTGLEDKYNIGDKVKSNCTSAGSRPEAQLKWFINNRLAAKNYLRGPWYRTTPNTDAVETILELSFIVGSNHFQFDTMDVKCQATIAPLYQEESTHHAVRYEIQSLKPYTDEPILGEKPIPTFSGFGDTTLLQLEEGKTSTAAPRLHLNLFFLFLAFVRYING